MRTIKTEVSYEYANNMTHTHAAWLHMDVTKWIIDLVDICHCAAIRSSWWHAAKTSNEGVVWENIPLELNFAERLALIHSEISEALEGGRKDLQSDHIPDFSMVDEELADALIRIFDTAGGIPGCRLGEAFVAKMRYNATRADHKPRARAAEGGKKF